MATSFSISPRPGARPRSLGEVEKALQQLLREPASIRDLSTVLEALLDVSAASKHPVLLSKPPARGTGSQPPFVRRILDGSRQLAREQVAQAAPILLCSTPARFHRRRLLELFLPTIVVLSPREIPPMVPVQSLGTVR